MKLSSTDLAFNMQLFNISERAAWSLASLRFHQPEAPVHLVSDGGEAYEAIKELAERFLGSDGTGWS